MRETEQAAVERATGCQLDWMRRAGLWTAADDAEVFRRYGPGAFDSHWFCCVARPWDK